MKKYSVLLSAVVAIAALVSCNKEIAEPVKIESEGNVPFVLKADIPQTKLALADDWSLNWEDGDVIYAVTTDEEWGKAYTVDKNGETIAEFVCKDGDFTTTKTISDKEHTFNFLYAPESQKSYHRGASTTYKIPGTQAQDCSVPTAGIKNYYPLAGQVTVTTPADDITADMSHLATIVKVTLKNPTKENLAITSFSISMPDANIAGVFPIAFGETPAFTQEGAKSVSSSVTVNLTNGTVAAGAELPVYVVLAPVANYSGKITMTATDSKGLVYEKTNTVSALSFEAGTYNTASFSLKDGVKPDYLIANGDYAILAKRTSGNYFFMTSDLGSASTKRFQAVDSGLSTLPESLEVNGEQIWTVTNSADGMIISANSGKQITWSSDNSANLAVTGKLLSATESETAGAFNISIAETAERILALNTSNPYFAFYKGSQVMDLFFVPATLSETISYNLSVSPTSITGIEALNASAKKITVTTNAPDWKATTEEDWITIDVNDKVVTLTFSDNVAEKKSTSERTGKVTISSVLAGASIDVSVTQNGKEYVDPSTGTVYTLVSDASTLKSGDVIVLGCAAKGKVASAVTSTGKFLEATDATIADGALSCSNAAEITLGGDADGWTLTISGSLIYAKAAKELSLTTGTSTWTIDIADGAATISSTNSNYGRFLYNASSPRFLNYTSATSASMLLPEIYKKND